MAELKARFFQVVNPRGKPGGRTAEKAPPFQILLAKNSQARGRWHWSFNRRFAP
jgi:hypothetical protein